MPNAAKTPSRTIRIPDELWSFIKRVATEQKTTPSAIVVSAIRQYVADNKVEYGDWQ